MRLEEAPRLYRVYDIALRSNLPLDGVMPFNANRADCQFELCGARPQANEYDWFHEWTLGDGESTWLKLSRLPTGFLLRFPRYADFEVAQDARRVACYPVHDVPLPTIRHLLLDQVMPLVLAHMGRCVLHASAVVTGQGDAIAFAAPAGFGKSTLAGSLASQGCTLLTDDGLLLTDTNEGLACVPSYPGVRLWGDSANAIFGPDSAKLDYAHYTTKQRVDLSQNKIEFRHQDAPLSRVYFLSEPGAVSQIEFTTLSSREAFIELVRYTFQLDIGSPVHLRANFKKFDRLASHPVYFRLDYPRDWSSLSNVCDAVLHHSAK